MTARTKKQQAYDYGLWAETWCVICLMLKGYRIIERRHRTHYGEIDLIATRGKQLVFIEVKARRSIEAGLYALKPAQQQRIMRAAAAYIAAHRHRAGFGIRFDFMVVSGLRWPKHISHAFEA